MCPRVSVDAVTVLGTALLLCLEGTRLSSIVPPSSVPFALPAQCLNANQRLQQGVMARAWSATQSDDDESPAPIFPESDCTYPADNNFEKIITTAHLTTFLENASQGFSYKGMTHSSEAAAQIHKDLSCAIQADSRFASFCNSSDKYSYEENAFVNVSECAAFLAHVFVHTNSFTQFEETSNNRECRESEKYPCGPSTASYHGRGPLMIRGNDDYGRLGEYLFDDAEKLLLHPRLIEPQGISGWVAALWKWMEQRPYGLNCPETFVGSGKASCHDAILNQDVSPEVTMEALTDNDREKLTKGVSGFGLTINILAGEAVACCPSALKDALAAVPKPVLLPSAAVPGVIGVAESEAATRARADLLLKLAERGGLGAGALTPEELKKILAPNGARQGGAAQTLEPSEELESPDSGDADEESRPGEQKPNPHAALGAEQRQQQLFDQIMSAPPPPADGIPVQPRGDGFLQTQALALPSTLTRFVVPSKGIFPSGSSASQNPLSSAAATSAFLSFLAHLLYPHPTPSGTENTVPLPSGTVPPTPFPLPGDANRLCTTRGVLSARAAESNAANTDAAGAATAADTFCLSVVRGCPVMFPPSAVEINADQGDEDTVNLVKAAASGNAAAVIGPDGEKCNFVCVDASNNSAQSATNGAVSTDAHAAEDDALAAKSHAEAVANLKTEEFELKSFEYLPKSGVVCGYTCVSHHDETEGGTVFEGA
ncbi:chitinase-like protein CLP1 [Toxoplasma gondii TgCatPRC2]|uniref:Chitinase class I, putative n=10 Tax=Toxoplasma gondii TaxID=5811 RepID=B9PY66_TOXGV|nr:chitinase-like protein CLP1 [Toxoplasma gondii ME49]EPR57608.1 chitinase-like protein CLP1 [Toxoplasma gondii GT1]ESS29271.1 chitinase-like protein CLP1 [Toxoplasma gondii VEG]KAF4646119.1 chitinase-like protein CLP1 [Toxoplasma gondii]KFG35692.1 chitinase-like protein CLP1 [Toxoplasma gondii p89]KFH14364.1 chitinase-like protein CLP1 [Toxoplasma gondii MAS]KYF39786.1 chitinase-like protein CLP1 [Toxoplasma gondii ARI]KYK65928.1 chitinase-like protein CLP1 [Toxoplasma gondii TgCatPRC2]PU|eukprot:XP_002370178.1 chitinase-like protein CLP1 [Toxoplasma gondii ME49]